MNDTCKRRRKSKSSAANVQIFICLFVQFDEGFLILLLETHTETSGGCSRACVRVLVHAKRLIICVSDAGCVQLLVCMWVCWCACVGVLACMSV